MSNQFLDPNDQTSVNNYVDLRVALVLKSVTELNNLDAGDAPALIYEGKIFQLDSADTTSTHDGTSVIVDSNGKRFKVFGVDRIPKSVLGNAVVPPANPNVGDAYFVWGTGAPSGAFANRREYIAVYTLWEWRFILAPTGTRIYNENDGSNYYFDGNIWPRGDPSPIADGTIIPSALVMRTLVVQNIQNDPPAAIPNGQAFIVGGNPTGAWAANPNDIAYGDGTQWHFINPRAGEIAYNSAAGQTKHIFWNGGAWVDL